MTNKWYPSIVSGLGLYLVGVGLLTAAVLSLHDNAMRNFQTYLGEPGPSVPQAPWATHIQRMDEALAGEFADVAAQAWWEAYVAALLSRRWDALIDVGNAALRIGDATGQQGRSQAQARGVYWTAFFHARQQRSADGVLRAAEGFAALGDREVAARCVRLAEQLATRRAGAGEPAATEQLVAHLPNRA